MKQENFRDFTEEHFGKVVIATVKNPKKVIQGKLEKGVDPESKKMMYCIKNGKMTFIDHENVKAINVVLTKEERRRRQKIKFSRN